MQRRRQHSVQARTILAALADRPKQWQHGYELSKETGIKSGTLYPLLIRLSEKGLLQTAWRDSDEPGRPPRHVYRLTARGLEAARELASNDHARTLLRPARTTA